MYTIFIVGIAISGCMIFTKTFYTNIFVSGPSMLPTLLGENNMHHYGIADTSNSAIDNLKRFDVIITYYPKSWGASEELIVKRIWGFPGETLTMVTTDSESRFKVTVGEETRYTIVAPKSEKVVDKVDSKVTMNTYCFKTERKIFHTNAAQQRTFTITLNDNQYFVMGDNWGNSTDSFAKITSPERLNRSNIQGKVICIQGYAKVEKNGDEYNIIEKHEISPMYNF